MKRKKMSPMPIAWAVDPETGADVLVQPRWEVSYHRVQVITPQVRLGEEHTPVKNIAKIVRMTAMVCTTQQELATATEWLQRYAVVGRFPGKPKAKRKPRKAAPVAPKEANYRKVVGLLIDCEVDPLVESLEPDEVETAREHLRRRRFDEAARYPLELCLERVKESRKWKPLIAAAETDKYAHALVVLMAQEIGRWNAIGKYLSPKDVSNTATRYWAGRQYALQDRIREADTLSTWATQYGLFWEAVKYEQQMDTMGEEVIAADRAGQWAKAEIDHTTPYDG